MSNLFRCIGLAGVAVLLAGCANMTETQKGTAAGAGIGAVAGAAIGAATGDGGGKRAGRGAAIGAAAGAVGGYIWSKKMEEQRQQMEQDSRGTGIGVTKTTDNRLKLNIPADAGFDTSRSEIKPTLRSVLDRYSKTLNEHAVTTIDIVGHTDAKGSDTVNDPLSLARAESARNYLTSRGVAASRIAVAGRGKREPVADNGSESGRAQNRRIEIYIAEPVQGS
ncbi:MAG TPA: OmpA family protein [Burkholderiaceae bacterium]|nr:OmpA family protein [Burkholderiaceae bacterium]